MNLQPLKVNLEKKKKAQDLYYENNCSNSPMRRDLNKRPVKHRLGLIPYGTNTSSILPKIRLRRQTMNNRINNRKFVHNRRVNLAQQRLNYIRSKHRQTLSIPNKMKLHRVIHNGVPRNFQVQVQNTSSPHYQKIKRFKQILNDSLQTEIRQIQSSYKREETMIPTMVSPAITGISMHKRFGLLSSFSV